MAKKSDIGDAAERERTSRKEFDAAHEEGMAALKRHDHAGLSKAIKKEGAAIEKHSQAIDEVTAALPRHRILEFETSCRVCAPGG